MGEGSGPEAGRRSSRLGIVIGISLTLLLVAVGVTLNWYYPSASKLTSVATAVPVSNARHPVRIESHGSRFPLPLAWLQQIELVYERPPEVAADADLRKHWEKALESAGWQQRHGERFEFGQQPWGWWTKGRFALALTLKADETRGQYFEWGTGEILVEVSKYGDTKGQIPGPHQQAHSDAGARFRKPVSEEASALFSAPGRTQTGVYECPDCGQRLAGERRCPDCKLFTRRIGDGGTCTSCGEILPSANSSQSTSPTTTDQDQQTITGSIFNRRQRVNFRPSLTRNTLADRRTPRDFLRTAPGPSPRRKSIGKPDTTGVTPATGAPPRAVPAARR